jgi:hypothetical protein
MAGLALKNTWAAAQSYAATDQNDVANAINARLNEIFVDYAAKLSLPTTGDDAAAHAFSDVKGVSAASLSLITQNDVQTLTMTATGGTFTLTYKGQTMPTPRANNIALATLQSDLQALSTIGSGNITVTGTAGSNYIITASGALAGTLLDDIIVNNGSLTGGTAVINHTTNGGGRLINGDSTSTTASSIYRTAAAANTTSYMAEEFDFGSAGSTNGGCVTLACWAATPPSSAGVLTSPPPDSPCHCDFFLDQFQFGVFQGGSLTILFIYSYDTIFATNKYQYAEIGIDKAGATVAIRAPDGTVWSVSHSQIGAVTAPYATHETYSTNSTTDHEPQIARFAADSTALRANWSTICSKANSLITDGRAALRNYIPVNTLQLLDQTFANRRAKFDLNANSSTAGQTSTLFVPYRSGVVINKVATQTAEAAASNSAAELTIISAILGTNELSFAGAGAVYKFTIAGSLTLQATSGALTFRVYLGATAAAQTFVMPTQASAIATAAPFMLEVWAQVRTTGSGGTYIAGGYGLLWPTTTTVIYILAAAGAGLASTAAVDTTAATPTAKLTCQFATASLSNAIKVEVATIERPM